MLCRTEMKLAAMMMAMTMIGGAGLAMYVMAAETPVSAPATQPAVSPEATKLRVALAEVEVEMAKAKYQHAQRTATLTEQYYKQGIRTAIEVEQAQSDSNVAGLTSRRQR